MRKQGKLVKLLKAAVSFALLLTAVFCVFRRLPGSIFPKIISRKKKRKANKTLPNLQPLPKPKQPKKQVIKNVTSRDITTPLQSTRAKKNTA